MPSTSSRRIGALAVVAGLALSGCASAPDQGGEQPLVPSGGPDASEPLTINNCGYDITFEETPSKVLIMQGASVGEAETFVLLGLEDTILANAQYYGLSDIEGMAEEVDALPDGGLKLNDAMDVPAEQILGLKPDLVISTWSGGFNEQYGFGSRETLHEAGINTLVNPVNCAYGKTGEVSEAEQAAFAGASVQSSLDFITLIGEIFDVEDKAEEVVGELESELKEASDAVGDVEPVSMLLAFPSMTAMNANGLPAVFSGGIYDSVMRSAGGENAFLGDPTITETLSAEQLAVADVELLILGAFRPDEDLEAEAEALFAAYPEWSASKTKSWVGVSDGVYLGPANAEAIDAIARKAHPDAFSE